MKIICKPRPRPHRSGIDWKRCLPFVLNPRGYLIHRVRFATSHFRSGEHTHNSVTYWCGNSTCGIGKRADVFFSDPPSDRLLCVHCEAKAVASGEPTAAELAGRHVCIGKLRAVRLCCRRDDQ